MDTQELEINDCRGGWKNQCLNKQGQPKAKQNMALESD
jgi:hypothetical protein